MLSGRAHQLTEPRQNEKPSRLGDEAKAEHARELRAERLFRGAQSSSGRADDATKMRIKDNENAVLDAQQHSREDRQPPAKPTPVPNPESRPTPGVTPCWPPPSLT